MLLRSRWAAPSGFIEPCLPSRADRPPSGPDWIHEIKHDGYRLMARRDSVGIRLLTRNGHDWSPRYPLIVEAVNRLKARSCLMDGEAVACDENGLTVFERLRHQYELALCRLRRAPRLPFPPARSPRLWCGCGGGLRLHQRQHQPRLRVNSFLAIAHQRDCDVVLLVDFPSQKPQLRCAINVLPGPNLPILPSARHTPRGIS